MPYEVESDESIDEMMEAFDESNDESDEAARSWRPKGKVASGRNLYSPRPQSQYVTQQQLQTALAKVGAQVRTNSNTISQIGTHVTHLTAHIKREAVDRKKDINALRSSLSQTQQMSAIMPLLTQPKSLATTGLGLDGLPDGTKVMVDSGSSFSLLLPMLLMGSMGDSSTTTNGSSSPMGGGGLFGGGDGNMMSAFLMFAVLGGLK
jgi:hypothetical protein